MQEKLSVFDDYLMLCGSASPVLTATTLVNYLQWQSLISYRWPKNGTIICTP